MTERELVWLPLAGKERPAVVLRVAPGWAEVIYGTRAEREWPAVVVHPDTRQGRRFGLTAPTYFYAINRRWAEIGILRSTGSRCTVELFIGLRALLENMTPP